ncbi:TolC family protein [Butyricimonas virosa]|uniref:TolC family protein n=1 Tax=Butyricimonas virosa TaxID=544645 RepID=UPI003AB0DB50
MIKQLLPIITMAVLLCSCSVYKRYSRPDDLHTADLYGDMTSSDTASLGQLPWRSVFPDRKLQTLIERGLHNNSELRIAQLRIDQAEASLKAAKLAFLPSLNFSTTGSASSIDGNKATLSYHVPIEASWQVDVFGRLRNAKERGKVLVENSQAYRQAVQTRLICSVALQYYSLVVLREQLVVLEQTKDVWSEMVRAMRVLMETGPYNDAAVSQAEANYNGVCGSISDYRQRIREEENALSVLLGEPVHEIESGSLEGWRGIDNVLVGVPLLLLSQRPDVRQAELNLAAAFYATNEARSAFYPSITLGGNAGWTNVVGSIGNPGKLLLEAIGSLTQPLFQNGRLRAELKIARARQEEAKIRFQQSLLNAGMEVNNNLTQMQTYGEKAEFYAAQVSALERTIRSTRFLMENGSSNYLDVLTAQRDMLSARLSYLTNIYNEISAYIAIYQALGGGSD